MVQAAASTVQCQWIELLAGGTGSLSLPLSVRTMETTTPSPAPGRVLGFMIVVLVTGPLHMKVIEILSFPELHVLVLVTELQKFVLVFLQENTEVKMLTL